MSDKRELILARLAIVLQTVPNVESFVRNRGVLPDEKRPAISMLDANEEADERAFNRGRAGASPNLVMMKPEIRVMLQDQKPDNATVGQLLNAYRAAILAAVLLDEVLQMLVGTSGEMRYDGCVTDLVRGQSMDGEMSLQISFVYPFDPSQL